jgi:integrase
MAKRPNYGGVWPFERPGRPNPYGVQWREKSWSSKANGGTGGEIEQKKTEFYDTAEKRDARAAELRKQRKGGTLATATRSEVGEWRAFQSAVNGVPWQDVVAGWRAWMMQSGLTECTVTVEEAVKSHLLAAKKRSETEPPQLSPDTYRQKKHKLTLFTEQFGHLRLNQIEARDVEAWIEDFDDVKAEGTFNNYRKHVRALIQPHVDSGLLRRNPIDAVKLRDDSTGEVGILTVQQTARLFSFALVTPKYREAIGRLALEAFVGLRFSSGCRLEKSDLKFKERGILLPKHKLKTRSRHYIDGMPDQVWAWLDPKITPDSCWELTPRQYMELKSNLFTEAGVPHPFNCFRHSFCTYDVAAHKNPGRTAYLLCHKDQDLLWARYKGNATEADGKLYQTITPQTALLLAKDYVPLVARSLPAA